MFKRHSFEASIAGAFFIALFCVILVQIFGRTDLFTGPVWTEELARWLWVWMALIGIGAVEKKGAHLRMGFLMEMLPKGVQRGFALVTDIVYLAIAGHLLWISYKTILRTWRNESVSLPTTDAVLYASAFFALLLIIHRIVRRLIAGRNANPNVEAPL